MERDRKKHIVELLKNFLCTKTMYNCKYAQACKHITLAYFLLWFQLNSSVENEALKGKEYNDKIEFKNFEL